MTEVALVVRDIIARQAMLAVDQVRLQDSPEALGLDSLGLVESIFAIEEAFDISVPFNANETGQNSFDISTIGSVVAAVEALVAAKSA
ncbi:MAG: acyl carrier protein [bacterium]